MTKPVSVTSTDRLDCADATLTLEMTRWLRIWRRTAAVAQDAGGLCPDLRQCLVFLGEHWQAGHTERVLPRWKPANQAFMAMRRADDIGGRSLMRALAGLRSFGRFLEREGKGKVARCRIRAPKIGQEPAEADPDGGRKRLADAKNAPARTAIPDLGARRRRDALLYGSGLRISEALGLKKREVPLPGEGDVIIVTGKATRPPWCRCCRTCWR